MSALVGCAVPFRLGLPWLGTEIMGAGSWPAPPCLGKLQEMSEAEGLLTETHSTIIKQCCSHGYHVYVAHPINHSGKEGVASRKGARQRSTHQSMATCHRREHQDTGNAGILRAAGQGRAAELTFLVRRCKDLDFSSQTGEEVFEEKEGVL